MRGYATRMPNFRASAGDRAGADRLLARRSAVSCGLNTGPLGDACGDPTLPHCSPRPRRSPRRCRRQAATQLPTHARTQPHADLCADRHAHSGCHRGARVRACGIIRLRDAPGTAGGVVMHLPADAPLETGQAHGRRRVGRAITADGARGWVSAEYVEAESDLGALAVTGSAVDAPPRWKRSAW